MKTFIYRQMAGFFDKERGMMLSYLGLIVFSVIKPLYALDEARYARLSQEATIALGRLDVLISMLKRRVL